MPSYKEIYSDRWLAASHLQGKIVPITITHVDLQQIYDRTDRTHKTIPAAHFAGRDIMLSLNRTRCQALEDITGSVMTEEWRDVRVLLRADRAPNGKATITILPAASKAPAPAQEVHGRAESEPVHGLVESTPVHGLAQESVVHGLAAESLVHGLAQPEPVHGRAESEVKSAVADPKSTAVDQRPGEQIAEQVFMTPYDLVIKAKNLHQRSTEPMVIKQHVYLENLMRKWTDKPPAAVWKKLLERDVTDEDRAGVQVGPWLFKLLSRAAEADQGEISALETLCSRIK